MDDPAVYQSLTKRFGRELAELMLTYLELLQGNSFKVSKVAALHFQRNKASMATLERGVVIKKRAHLSSKLYFFLKEMEKHDMGVEFIERTSGGSWFKFDREILSKSLKELIASAGD